MNNRRRFITLAPFAAGAVLAACSKEATFPAASPAPAAPMLAPTPDAPAPVAAQVAASGAKLPLLEASDPLALSLGYVALASRADGSKYNSYAPGQACGNCSIYRGTANEAQAPCPLFAGKQVVATGWCSAYVKKAG